MGKRTLAVCLGMEHQLQGRQFVAADSQFRATFPGRPRRSIKPVEALGTTVDTVVYRSDLGTTTFFVQTFDLTAGVTYDLNGGMNGIAAALDGDVQSAAATTWQGFEAVDALLTTPRDQAVKLRAIGTPKHVYLLVVISMNDPVPEFDKFAASFEILL